MTVTTPTHYLDQIEQILPNMPDSLKQGIIKYISQESKSPNDELYFFHPALLPEDAINLTHFLDIEAQKIFTTQESEQTKKEHIATVYWLLAQSTPVTTGGSAFANLMLHYTAHYADIKIPYTKEGVDLWAHAAMQTLETFKTRFVSGDYHDPFLTDQQVENWLSNHMDQQQQTLQTIVDLYNIRRRSLDDRKDRAPGREQ